MLCVLAQKMSQERAGEHSGVTTNTVLFTPSAKNCQRREKKSRNRVQEKNNTKRKNWQESK